jgi:hypothetical protein
MAKGKLFALLAVFAAIGVVTATGAFTTVSAERTAQVNVAGDASALLALSPTDSEFSTTENNQLTIDLGTNNVNPNAVTTDNEVFTVTNNGEDPVRLVVTPEGPNENAVVFGIQKEEFDSSTIPSDGTGIPISNVVDGDEAAAAIGDGDYVRLDPGESITVGIFVDTTDGNALDAPNSGGAEITSDQALITSVTINADSIQPDEASSVAYNASST